MAAAAVTELAAPTMAVKLMMETVEAAQTTTVPEPVVAAVSTAVVAVVLPWAVTPAEAAVAVVQVMLPVRLPR